MTIDRMAYVGGFTAADFYSGAGLFRGSVPAGFVVAALFRMNPRAQVDDVDQFVCGNFADTGAPGGASGWQIAVQQDPSDAADYTLRFLHADGAGLVVAMDADMAFGPPMPNGRTMLVHVFFGMISSDTNDGLGLALAVNGSIIIPPGNFDLVAGYSAAPANNPFRIGSGPSIGGGANVPAQQGVSGFAYFDGAPQSPGSKDASDEVRSLAAAHYNQVQRAQDMVTEGMPQITDLYSVRRAQPNPAATWAASEGGTVLTRQGTENLRCDASKPRFLSHNWTFVPPA